MLNNTVYSDQEPESLDSNVQNISEKSLEEEINLLQSKLEQIKKPKKKDNLLLLLLLLLASLLALVVSCLYFYPSEIRKLISKNNSIISNYPSQTSSPQEIMAEQNKKIKESGINLQKVTNVGYEFYLGEIGYSGVSSINDEVKNAITDVIYKSNFPKNLLKNIGIIITNTLAINSNTNIKTPSGTNLRIPNFPAVFLSGGGLYSQSYNNFSLIFINTKKLCSSDYQIYAAMMGQQVKQQSSCYVDNNFLKNTLTHELGHHIGSKMTDAEWVEFYKLRNIPSNTPRQGDVWQTSPTEDFAEVYTNTYTGSDISTTFGLITKTSSYDEADNCQKIHENLLKQYFKNDMSKYYNFIYSGDDFNTDPTLKDSQLQSCRKEVLLNPDKYPDVVKKIEMFGSIYKSISDQTTKDFIKNIVNRLNQ